MNRARCIGRRDDSSHVFVCPACRTEARIAGAWRALRVEETPASPGERFVRKILVRVEHDRTARRRLRWLAAAAAAALFSFFAGLAHEHAASQASPTADESYAALASPSSLEALIPN